MAILAFGHHFVFVLVAGYAKKLAVFGFVGRQQGHCIFVAGSTEIVGHGRTIGDHRGHMGLMTAFAVGSGHVAGVGFVTLGTLGNLSMHVMAKRTVQRAMLALVFPELLDLAGMAGETGFGYVAAEGDILWSMRILVAREASRELEVRLFGVAHVAFRDRMRDGRRMPDVAILAGNACFVCSACSCNVCGLFGVAFDAVEIAKSCRG